MSHSTSPRHRGGLWPYLKLLLIALCVFAGEMIAGLSIGSLALISDASHTLSDSIAVLLALWFESGYHKRSEQANQRRQLLTRLAIGALIIAAGVRIGIEGYERIVTPHTLPSPPWILVTATVCIFANREMLRALGDCPCHIDSHLRAHVSSDIWISVGVLAGGLATAITGTPLIDAWLSLAIAAWILRLGTQVVCGRHAH